MRRTPGSKVRQMLPVTGDQVNKENLPPANWRRFGRSPRLITIGGTPKNKREGGTGTTPLRTRDINRQ